MAYYSSDIPEPDQCITIPSVRTQDTFTVRTVDVVLLGAYIFCFGQHGYVCYVLFQEYEIHIDIRGTTWTVYRRYSEFDELNQQVSGFGLNYQWLYGAVLFMF